MIHLEDVFSQLSPCVFGWWDTQWCFMSSHVFTSFNVRLTVFAPVFACFHLHVFGYVQSNACYESHPEALCYWSSVAPYRTRWRLQHPLFSFWLPHSQEWSMAPISLVSWMCQTWAHWHMDQQHPMHQQIPPHCRFKSTCGWHVEVQRFEWSTAAIEKQFGLHIVAPGWHFGVSFLYSFYVFLSYGFFLFACVSYVGDCLGMLGILQIPTSPKNCPTINTGTGSLMPSLGFCRWFDMICLVGGAMLVERSVLQFQPTLIFTGNYNYPQNVKIEAPIVVLLFFAFWRVLGACQCYVVICQPGGYYWLGFPRSLSPY